jgi:hypothetical protein
MASSVHRALALPTMLFALAGCGLQACGPSDPDRETDTACDDRASPDGGKATVELGDAISGEVVPFGDDATLVLQHGPQGGQHVYVSVGLYVTEPGTWTHTLRFEQEGASSAATTLPVEACSPGWTVTRDARVFLDRAGSQEGTITVKTVREGDTPDHALVDQVSVSILDE